MTADGMLAAWAGQPRKRQAGDRAPGGWRLAF
jgi:hypothetical protein